MRVVAVTHRDVRWPLEPRGSARSAGRERTATLVAVRDATGATGLGEAAPLPGFSPDTLEDAHAAVAELACRMPLQLETPRHASAVADRVSLAPAARFAVETALLALYAQAARTSVARLLSPLPHAELRHAVVVDGVDEAALAVARGARCLKLKVGGDPEVDIRRVHAVARHAPGALLRLDANRGWSRGDIDAIARELAGLPIDYIEEPCVDAHELLACELPVRIALDESLATLDRAALTRALASPRLAALVLKPTLLGGFARCLELAEEAHRNGVAPVVTHTLEGPVGFAACHELARVVGADVPVGLAPHPALERFEEATWSQPESA